MINRVLGFTQSHPQYVVVGTPIWDEMKRLGMLEEIRPDKRAYMIWKGEQVPGMEVVHDRFIPDEDDTVYVIEKGVW